MADHHGKSVTSVTNSCSVREIVKNICNKFDMMFEKRAYIHWFLDEGMEEGEFIEARENLGFLDRDYIDVTAEQIGSDED